MKRRYPPLGANSPKRLDTTGREISCRSARRDSWAARSFRRGPSKATAILRSCDPALIRSDTFEMEWPPRSGRRRTFPEIDRAAWFGVAEARRKILKGQMVFVDRLLEALGPSSEPVATTRRSVSGLRRMVDCIQLA